MSAIGPQDSNFNTGGVVGGEPTSTTEIMANPEATSAALDALGADLENAPGADPADRSESADQVPGETDTGTASDVDAKIEELEGKIADKKKASLWSSIKKFGTIVASVAASAGLIAFGALTGGVGIAVAGGIFAIVARYCTTEAISEDKMTHNELSSQIGRHQGHINALDEGRKTVEEVESEEALDQPKAPKPLTAEEKEELKKGSRVGDDYRFDITDH